VKLATAFLLFALGCAGAESRLAGSQGFTAEEWAERCAEPFGSPFPETCVEDPRPIGSELSLACRARSAIPADAKPMTGDEWHYTILEGAGSWQVGVHPPTHCVRGGSYLVEIDASSGEVLSVQPQR
jgi:hypothetical protein